MQPAKHRSCEAAVIHPEILMLIGLIVLSTQDAEKYIKIILPFSPSKDPSLRGALKRMEKLSKDTFGGVIKKFVKSSSSTSNRFEQHVSGLVKRRNQLVHHFGEAYGDALRSGNHQKIIDALRIHLNDVNTL